MRRLFWACAGLSLGLHLALATAWQPHPARTAAALNHLRPPPRLPSRLVVLAPTLPAPAATVASVATVATVATAVVPPASGEPDDTTAGIDADAASTADDRAIEHDPLTVAAASGWDDYLPRSLLTITPSPREDIRLDYPADGPIVGRFVLTMTLYIDETGAVRRVDVASDEHVPAALHQAAHAAFVGRRFSPGELAGGVVKSRIRIEALFESLALPKFAADAAVADAAAAGAITAH